jgi:hypothetical protein
MGQGTGHHAGATALAFFQINEKKSFRVWDRVRYRKQFSWQHKVCTDRGRKAQCTSTQQELAPRDFIR